MQLSTRTRYALRMMVDMTLYEAYGNVKIKDISKRQDISVKYLEQIITTLSKAGYVRGERGPQGGYRLGMDPKDITAGMIVRLMEGGTAPAPCAKGEDCPRASECVTSDLWKRISAAVDEILDSTTIADLAENARKQNLVTIVDSPEYFI